MILLGSLVPHDLQFNVSVLPTAAAAEPSPPARDIMISW